MLEEHFRRPRVCERIRSNPIAEQILEFIEFLDHRGHAPLTIQLYVQHHRLAFGLVPGNFRFQKCCQKMANTEE